MQTATINNNNPNVFFYTDGNARSFTVTGPTPCDLEISDVYTCDEHGEKLVTSKGAPYMNLRIIATTRSGDAINIYEKIYSNNGAKLQMIAKAVNLDIPSSGSIDVTQLRGKKCAGVIDKEAYGNEGKSKTVIKEWLQVKEVNLEEIPF